MSEGNYGSGQASGNGGGYGDSSGNGNGWGSGWGIGWGDSSGRGNSNGSGADAGERAELTVFTGRSAMKNNYYIVRCVNSGVFFATGVERTGKEAVLEWSRMIHYWEGAAALSQVARNGIRSGRVCVPVEGRKVLDICEIIPCTEAAASNLLGQPEWRS